MSRRLLLPSITSPIPSSTAVAVTTGFRTKLKSIISLVFLPLVASLVIAPCTLLFLAGTVEWRILLSCLTSHQVPVSRRVGVDWNSCQ